MEAVSLFTLELARSAGAFTEVDVPWWVLYLVVSSGALALVWRRRYPVTVAVYLATHLFVTGLTMPEVMAQVSLQICYFVGLFSAMAWGRSRRTSLLLFEGTALTVASYVPPFSSVLMPMRVLEGDAAWWEPVAAIGVLLAAMALTVRLAARLYRRALLQTQGRVTLKQAWSAAD